MRALTILFLFFTLLSASAEQFTVFEKDGYFGIRSEDGEVTVPPVYEKLGWSDGSSEVIDGVIGFREDRSWGLITVKNKLLTELQFYSINPFSQGRFKVAVKGKFSNQLFYGLINAQGKIVVNFNYFSLDAMEDLLLVSKYENGGQWFGVISQEDELLIPLKYRHVSVQNGLTRAELSKYTIDLYQADGELILEGQDSIIFNDGWKSYREGYAAFLNKKGKLKYAFDFKNFMVEDGSVIPVEFPEWKVFKEGEFQFEVKADSIKKSHDDLWVIYNNGAHHLQKAKTMIQGKHSFLQDARDNHLIMKHSKSKKWAVITTNGDEIFSGYDSIFFKMEGFIAQNERGWFFLSERGERLNRLPFTEVVATNTNQYVVKRNEHWGIVDENAEVIAEFKYDQVKPVSDQYIIAYLNRWGMLNQKGLWDVRPEYAEILFFDHWIIGRKGQGFSYFIGGRLRAQSTSKPKALLKGGDLLVENEDGLQGVITMEGEFLIYPEYLKIQAWEDYYELSRDSLIEIMYKNGQLIISQEENIQEVGGIGEDYLLIRKQGRWGFIDSQGRLRISNRYEDAKPFSDGLAAIKLKGRWGFINRDERIKIQPHYDEVGAFYGGVCIVSEGEKMGLINTDGDIILEPVWKSIERLSSGNYRIVDFSNKVGLVDTNGSFLLRPAFDAIEDVESRLIVLQNGKYGVLDYDGNQLFKIQYKEIYVSDNYTIVKY